MAQIEQGQPAPWKSRAPKQPHGSSYVPEFKNTNSENQYRQPTVSIYGDYRDSQDHEHRELDVARRRSQSPERPLHQGKSKRAPGMAPRLYSDSNDAQDREFQHQKRKAEPAKNPMQPLNQHSRKSVNARLRSLRRQLKYATNMRADLRQEREREVSSLLVEKTRTAAKEQRKKNLEKYHLVRFVERQKCERQLKQLLKAKEALLQIKGNVISKQKYTSTIPKDNDADSDVDMDPAGRVALPDDADSQLTKQIHEAEVNLNYTLYAPLGDKYISLFPLDGPKKISGMSRADQARLTKEQREEVLSNQNWNSVHNSTGEKPPTWYKVEECMAQGTLEQLREGKLTAAAVEIAHVGGKPEAARRTNLKDAPDWMKDSGEIAPEDLDSESESDNDGGFFER